VIVEIPEPAKAEPSIFQTDAGINNECNNGQSENTQNPLLASFDSDSNVNDEREVHPLKQC
jgi:hypothetical protein